MIRTLSDIPINIHTTTCIKRNLKSKDAQISTKLKFPYQVSTSLIKIQRDKDMIKESVTKYLRVKVHIRDMKGNNSNCFIQSILYY